MKSFTLSLAVCAILAAEAHAVTIAWSPVGNAGNANDSTGFGGVAYNYSIGTYDVTNSQYVAFLNSNVPNGETADPLRLYNSNMSNASFGGVNYTSSAASGNKYSVISGKGDNPVNYETWYSAIRFANWLDNNQVAGMTETGAYTLLGGTPTPSNASSIIRTTGATIVLPSENEWYKAAYYDPATNSYFKYATSSNTAPTPIGPLGAPQNSANYGDAVDNLTNVGAYTLTTSPYGAFDMNGDVFQWNEALIGSSRGARGGTFGAASSFLLFSSRPNLFDPSDGFLHVGFRVAMVPEPSSLVLAALGLIALTAWRLRHR